MISQNGLFHPIALGMRAPATPDSEPIGTWIDAYANQNCYGYVLGKTVKKNPGAYSGHSFSYSLSVSTLANYAIDDLEALGYTAYKTTTKPTSLGNFKKVMCVRKGTSDYHFMKGFL